jgi:hypothetical protein
MKAVAIADGRCLMRGVIVWAWPAGSAAKILKRLGFER